MIGEGHREYTDRTNATSTVIILVGKDEQNLLLVGQHGIFLDAPAIELPVGIIGDEPGSATKMMPWLPDES